MLTLTKQEQQIILFLGAMALLGMGVNYIMTRYHGTGVTARFSEDNFKINLNTADKETLMSVPGIGRTLAERILTYRQERERFRDPEDLKNIRGMTVYRYERVKNSFVVR